MGLPGVSLHLFNVYGPRQRADGPYAAVVTAFANRVLDGKPPIIHGDGSQTRDFVHVRDVVRAFLLAGASELKPMGEVVNVGSGVTTRIDELASVLSELPAVARAEISEGELTVFPAGAGLLEAVSNAVSENRWKVSELRFEAGRFDEVFRKITRGEAD